MTYQELKLSLEKCERSLKSIQDGTYRNLSKINVKETTDKLKVLKESLSAKLKEAEETMFVTTKGGDTKAIKMDRKAAMDLKKDPNVVDIDTAKGQDLKEGVKFSKEETMAIAKKVGKAVAKALNDVGDEVAHMKAKNIEPNSFEIHVEYKKDTVTDDFSFYISDDTLHLQDFSFDKELVDVGVKPSGEAIVHVDVLTNELVKHFKSLSEGMSPEEWEDAKEKERLDQHPEKDMIKKIQALIAKERGAKLEEAPEGMYYIKISKDAASQNKAQVIFNDLYGVDYEINDDKDGIFLYFPKDKFNAGMLDDLEGDGVEILDTNIPMDENEHHDIAGQEVPADDHDDLDIGHQDDEPDMLKQYAYDIAHYAAKLYKQLDKYDKMDGEVDFPNWWQSKVILAKDYISKAQHYLEFEEKQPAIDQLALEGKNEDMYKPAKLEKLTVGGKTYEIGDFDPNDDGRIMSIEKYPNGYYITGGVYSDYGDGDEPKEAYGYALNLDGIEMDEEDLEGMYEGKHQGTNYKWPMSQATKDRKEADKEKKTIKEWGNSDQHAMNQSMHKDLGNPDKFPGLSQVLAAAEAAVDFYWDDWPEYKNDREGLVTYAAQRYTSNMFPDFWSNMQKLFAPANEGKYKSDAQRKAIYATKAEKGELKEDSQDAIYELQDLLEELYSISNQVKSLMRQHFPNAYREGEAYGAFDFGTSTNSYDTTFEKILENLGSEEDLDELFGSKGVSNYDELIGPIEKGFAYLKKYVSKKEPDAMPDLQKAIDFFDIFDEKMSYGTHMELEEATVAKIQKAHGQVVAKMKELAKQYKAGDKSVVDQLKDLTAKKKELEKHLDKAVAGTNRNQELTEQACSCCGDNPCSCDESCPHCGGKGLYEEKATYCGACGKTHKKSQSCPK